MYISNWAKQQYFVWKWPGRCSKVATFHFGVWLVMLMDAVNKPWKPVASRRPGRHTPVVDSGYICSPHDDKYTDQKNKKKKKKRAATTKQKATVTAESSGDILAVSSLRLSCCSSEGAPPQQSHRTPPRARPGPAAPNLPGSHTED